MKKALTLIAVIFVVAAIIALPCGAFEAEGINDSAQADSIAQDSEADDSHTAVTASDGVTSEETASEGINPDGTGDNEADGIADGTASDGGISGGVASDGTASEGTSSDGTAYDGTNVFEAIYTLAGEHIGEIFACLACVFSGILMFCYKKGILPLISGGISALRGGVSELSKEAQKQTESSAIISDTLTERLSAADRTLSKMEEAIGAITEKIAKTDTQRESQLFRLVLLEEVNMLYEVFMAATLPEYQKERISAEVASMREKLKAVGCGEEEN